MSPPALPRDALGGSAAQVHLARVMATRWSGRNLDFPAERTQVPAHSNAWQCRHLYGASSN